MVSIGCNNSEELISLLTEDACTVKYIKLSFLGEIEQEIDELDYPAPKKIREKKLLIHTLPVVGYRQRLLDYAAELGKLRVRMGDRCATDVATHLWLGDKWLGQDAENNIRERIVDNLQAAKPVFDSQGFRLLIENVPYHGQSGWAKTISQPYFLKDVIEESKVGFLLDLAHLKITCKNLRPKITDNDYLTELDSVLYRVSEIHVSGVYLPSESPSRHRHLQLEENDYKWINCVLNRVKDAKNSKTQGSGQTDLIMVTLEYAGTGDKYRAANPCDPIALREQLCKLEKAVKE